MTDKAPKLGAWIAYYLLLPIVCFYAVRNEITARTDYPAWIDRAGDRLEAAGVL